jgi:hypothetical protein
MMEGRDATCNRRQEQAERVAAIIDARWKKPRYKGNFAVLGDLNDYPEGKTALGALLEHKGLDNVLTRLPEAERWRITTPAAMPTASSTICCYQPVSPKPNPGKPAVMRRGLPWRAKKVTEEQLEDVGENDPEASDHALLYMNITPT